MELYYVMAVMDRDRGEKTAALFQSLGLNLVLTTLARGTATGEHLRRYGLEAAEKAVVSTVASGEEAARLLKLARRELYIDIPGNGIMLTVPLKSVAGGRTLAWLTNSEIKGGVPKMEFSYELIVAILNEGWSDVLMDAAREAGAAGGTVLHAKGTGSRGAEKFFGVRLADEKDLVYVVAHKDDKAAIMRAIGEKAGPGTKAGAICFSLPISSVVGLRQRDADAEE